MANKYPYVASAGPLLRAVEHLRRSFPREVTADTLRKLGIAPKNESYVINILRFLGVIDDKGKKVDAKAKALLQHKEDAFANEFGSLVKSAYEELFELHGDQAWTLDRPTLTQFFRTTDHSTDVVGGRQAGTFIALAGLSGQRSLPIEKESPRVRKPARVKSAKESKKEKKKEKGLEETRGNLGTQHKEGLRQVGLTVRIEVNLPAEGDQETYDNIFRSIRKNLIDGE